MSQKKNGFVLNRVLKPVPKFQIEVKFLYLTDTNLTKNIGIYYGYY